MSAVTVLKALADQTRLRMVGLLAQSDELCACEIEALLGVHQSNASRHLGKLREAGVVDATREGQWIHYSLAAESPYAKLVHDLVKTARSEGALPRSDLERLQDYLSSNFNCHTIGDWKPISIGSRAAQKVANSRETSDGRVSP